ncbi:MAG: fasciclin domain-containing protein [Flavisolibacter sp.]
MLIFNCEITKTSKRESNCSEVVAADIDARRVVIHTINRVLLPPRANIVEVASERCTD